MTRHLVLLAAATVVVLGVALIYLPAGMIAAGAALGGLWWLLEDVDADDETD